MIEVCVVESCDRPQHARGWCNRHYARAAIHGDPMAGVPIGAAPVGPPPAQPAPRRSCGVDHRVPVTVRSPAPADVALWEAAAGLMESALHTAATGCIERVWVRWVAASESWVDLRETG